MLARNLGAINAVIIVGTLAFAIPGRDSAIIIEVFEVMHYQLCPQNVLPVLVCFERKGKKNGKRNHYEIFKPFSIRPKARRSDVTVFRAHASL
uniref:Secreted peptide n=1 Tax=Rhipicephalus pulchellus TaxID=72859 RepID=L7LUI2_RHIPC